MLNAQGLIDLAFIEAKTSKQQLVTLERGTREWDIDKWLGTTIDRVGRDFYYAIANRAPSHLNVFEDTLDFLESGKFRITDGAVIRSIRVAYTDTVNGELSYYSASPRSKEDYEVVPFRGIPYKPEYDIIRNTVEITPKPTETVPNGVILRYIEPFRRLTRVTSQYRDGDAMVEQTVPDFTGEVFGIPEQYREVIIPGVAMYILKAKGDEQGSQLMEVAYERRKETAIRQLRERTGRVARRSYPGGGRSSFTQFC